MSLRYCAISLDDVPESINPVDFYPPKLWEKYREMRESQLLRDGVKPESIVHSPPQWIPQNPETPERLGFWAVSSTGEKDDD